MSKVIQARIELSEQEIREHDKPLEPTERQRLGSMLFVPRDQLDAAVAPRELWLQQWAAVGERLWASMEEYWK